MSKEPGDSVKVKLTAQQWELLPTGRNASELAWEMSEAAERAINSSSTWLEAWEKMDKAMDVVLAKWPGYGAWDTEPRAHFDKLVQLKWPR